MRKLFLLLTCGLVSVSCVDEDYKIGDINTDNIAIGDENSEFRAPLARISVSAAELRGNGSDIRAFFDEADIWLPAPLPDQAKTVDIVRLQSESGYLDQLLDGLTDQMMVDDDKMDAVAGLIYEKYDERITVPGLSGDLDETTYKTVFRDAYRSSDDAVQQELAAQIRQTAGEYLSGLDKIEPLDYDLGAISLDGDVVKMLTSGTEEGKTALYLFGRIASLLPAGLELTPAFQDTGIAFTVGVEPDAKNAFDEVPVGKADLDKIVEGTRITIPIALKTYYPRSFSDENRQIEIRLSIRKTGQLNLDL